METTKLKIKRATLAYESRTIRRQELRARQSARMQRAIANPDLSETRLRKHGFSEAQIARIKRNRRRNETTVYGEAESMVRFHTLRDYRLTVTRPEARAAHLAYAYLKGKPYLSCEQEAAMGRMSPADRKHLISRVARHVRKHADNGDALCRPKDIRHWIEGGKTLAQEDELTATGQDGISSKLMEA